MQEVNETNGFQDLESRSTEQLEALLRADADGKQDIPAETLMQMLAVLRERGVIAVSSPEDTVAAWQRFQADHAAPEGEVLSGARKENTRVPAAAKKPRRWLRYSVAAAILCVLLTVVPPVLGAEGLFSAVARWTQDVFFFLPSSEETPGTTEGYVFSTDHPGLQQLHDAVAKLGVTQPVVPTWLPEGYELFELKTHDTEQSSTVFAVFLKGDAVITISVKHLKPGFSPTSRYHKNPGDPELYVYNGITHYLMQNVERWTCAWLNGDVQCSISAPGGKEEPRKILESIYEGGV